MTNEAEAEWFAANQANWDDRAPIHASSSTYDIGRFIDNPEHIGSVVDFDRSRLGDLSGVEIVHLQCHIGTDTISLARLGAKATGLDFSARSLAVARELSAACGTAVEFVESNVYDAVETLGRSYDYVYTGVGAINWLPDLDRWAEVVTTLLKDGGRFFMREGHPGVMPLEEEEGRLVFRYPYFHTEPIEWNDAETYADGVGEITHTRQYEWNHSISKVVNALIGHGMVIDRIDEYDSLEWQLVPMMKEIDGRFYLPEDLRDKIPLMYSIAAHKA